MEQLQHFESLCRACQKKSGFSPFCSQLLSTPGFLSPAQRATKIKSSRDLLLLFPSRHHFKGANVRRDRAGDRQGAPRDKAGAPRGDFPPRAPNRNAAVLSVLLPRSVCMNSRGFAERGLCMSSRLKRENRFLRAREETRAVGPAAEIPPVAERRCHRCHQTPNISSAAAGTSQKNPNFEYTENQAPPLHQQLLSAPFIWQLSTHFAPNTWRRRSHFCI